MSYIFEYYKIGKSVKISAICLATNIEVSIISPSNTGISDMQKLAIKKLNFIKAKNKNA